MNTKLLVVVVSMLLVSCGGGSGSSNPNPDQNPQTYGGVNQVANTAYSLQGNNGNTTGILRLVSANSGIIVVASDFDNVEFNLKGAVSSFNAASRQCLGPTSLSGSINKVAAAASITLSNCSVNGSNLTATVTITSQGGQVYSGNISATNVAIASKDTVVGLARDLPADNPESYNYNLAVPVSFTISGIDGADAGSFAMYGQLFGNFIDEITTTAAQPITMGNISGSATFALIDSTSVNLTINNLLIGQQSSSKFVENLARVLSFKTSTVAADQLQCNLLFTNLVSNGQLNIDTKGYITGCSGDVTTATGSATVNVVGNFLLQ